MVRRFGRYGVLCVLIAALILLSGCFTASAEDFYCLPQLSEEYVQLQSKINAILGNGAEYSAPISGSNRQAVQLHDLDGDGQDEAIAFISVSGSEVPLKIIVFRSDNGEYTEVDRIEGAGTDFESIDYIDMDGDGVQELLVGWKSSSDVKMLSVYSIRDFQDSQLFKTGYTQYAFNDLTEDGNMDVLVVGTTGSGSNEVELYTLSSDEEVVSTKALLSTGAQTISRIRTCTLRNGTPAIMTESVIDRNGTDGIVTDIFAYINSSVKNITTDSDGISSDTVRTYNVYSTDINGDGVIEVPNPVQLKTQSETTSYWKIEWYNYNRSGQKTLQMTTYHNFSDGWYLVLPGNWGDALSVRREDTMSGERTIVFSLMDDFGVVTDFLAVYTISGLNRAERATIDSRFTLLSENETIYAAEILNYNVGITISAELIKSSFHIIYSDWVTGET